MFYNLGLINLFLIGLLIIFNQQKFKFIMGKIEDLNQELDNIKTASAEEKAQVATKLAELNATVQELKDQVANGGSTEQLDGLILKAQGIIADIKGIYEPTTEEEEPPVV